MSSPETPTHDVFLCHNGQDKPVVRELAEKLTARGLRVWLDESEIRPGSPNMDSLELGLRQSATIAVLCSPAGPGPWAKEEIRGALHRSVQQGIYVIPVLLPGMGDRPALPLFLETRTWVDLRGGLTGAGMDSLCWGITGERPGATRRSGANGDSGADATSAEQSRDSGDEDALWHLQQQEMELREHGAGDEALQEVWRAMEALKRKRRESGNPVSEGAVVADRYVLRTELGHGGFGSVWKAWDIQTSTFVAVKVLHHHLARSEERVERFWRGARAMANLSHVEGIVSIIATDLELAGTPCFVMEYVPGGDLTAACRAGRVKPERALDILQKLCEAVAHAHEHGLVHRDIKPDNVLLDASGQPKLTDFDLVQAAGTSGATKGGMGSVLFCAREQMTDASTVDVRADVFSLGMVGVYMLAGQRAVESVYFDAASMGKFVADAQLAQVLEEACVAAVEQRTASVLLLLQRLRGLGAQALETSSHRCPDVEGNGAAADGDLEAQPQHTVQEQRVDEKVDVPAIPPRSEYTRRRWLQTLASVAGGSIVVGAVVVGLPGEGQTCARHNLGALGWASEVGCDTYGSWASITVGDVAVRFRYIAPGNFMMGSPEGESGRYADEDQHQVTLTKGYWLGETEVTQSLWASVTGERPSHFEGDNLPVEKVSWNDVQEFVASLNREKPGLEVRLPTEAEWEYACRAGTIEARYSAKLDDIAWYEENSANSTRPVGLKQPNAWGLYDMLGNVLEWCSDRWQDDLSADEVDPSGPTEGRNRVIRGGSWSDYARSARAAFRILSEPENRSSFLGLRLARGHQASRESK